MREPTATACRGAPGTVPGRGAGDACAGPEAERRPPCPFAPAQRGRHQHYRPGPRSDRTAARRFRLLPSGLSTVMAQAPVTRRRRGRPVVSSWVRKPPGCDRERDPPLWERAHDRAAPPYGGPIWLGQPIGHPARPGAPVAPVSGDRVPFPVRGRPPTPRGYPSAPSRALPRKDGHGLRSSGSVTVANAFFPWLCNPSCRNSALYAYIIGFSRYLDLLERDQGLYMTARGSR